MSTPRATWKGHLRLSLVSCPVALYPATSRTSRISFHLLNPETHNRIKMVAKDPETDEELERDQLIKGYEFQNGQYVTVTQEELDEIEVESTRTITLDRFVAEGEVDPLFFDTPYYMAPDGKLADETFRVILQAMGRKRRLGLGKVVIAQREHPVLVTPRDKGMEVMTLRAADEVRDDAPYFEDIGSGRIAADMVEMAERIIEQKEGPFDPKVFAVDAYQEALFDLIQAKIKGQRPVVPRIQGPAPVIDLMEALKKSLAGSGEAAKPASARKRKAPAHAAAGKAKGGTKAKAKATAGRRRKAS